MQSESNVAWNCKDMATYGISIWCKAWQISDSMVGSTSMSCHESWIIRMNMHKSPTAIYSILLRLLWGLNPGMSQLRTWDSPQSMRAISDTPHWHHFYNEEFSCGFLRSAHPRGSCPYTNFWLVHSSHDFQLFISSLHHLKLKHVEIRIGLRLS